MASKPGYLPANKTVNVGPNGSNAEIVLALKPLAATLSISVNVEDARALIDDQREYQSLKAKLQLPPGHHRISVEALGYATNILEVDLAPDKTENRNVTLERLTVPQLKEQADRLYRARAYKDVLKLSQYLFEVEPNNAAANRLAGLANLAQQNYANAENYLAKGLAANEVVEFPVRRHPREAFDVRKGHDTCDAVLILSKTDVEFRGRQYSNDNFKVPYTQLQALGILIKSNQAVYLSTKVSDAKGKKKDFNFYSPEHELSQSGRPYLGMLQRLLQPH